jgi:hypothetical protein
VSAASSQHESECGCDSELVQQAASMSQSVGVMWIECSKQPA